MTFVKRNKETDILVPDGNILNQIYFSKEEFQARKFIFDFVTKSAECYLLFDY